MACTYMAWTRHGSLRIPGCSRDSIVSLGCSTHEAYSPVIQAVASRTSAMLPPSPAISTTLGSISNVLTACTASSLIASTRQAMSVI